MDCVAQHTVCVLRVYRGPDQCKKWHVWRACVWICEQTYTFSVDTTVTHRCWCVTYSYRFWWSGCVGESMQGRYVSQVWSRVSWNFCPSAVTHRFCGAQYKNQFLAHSAFDTSCGEAFHPLQPLLSNPSSTCSSLQLPISRSLHLVRPSIDLVFIAPACAKVVHLKNLRPALLCFWLVRIPPLSSALWYIIGSWNYCFKRLVKITGNLKKKSKYSCTAFPAPCWRSSSPGLRTRGILGYTPSCHFLQR